LKFETIPHLIIISLLLAACVAIPSQPAEDIFPPTQTVSPSPSPSQTVVWFPPTRTPTPAKIMLLAPTPEHRPGIGSILLEDTFGSNRGWQTLRKDVGSVAFGRNEITIAISQPKGSLNSLHRTALPENFYLEITANPSLCRGDDFYGILLRAISNLDYYQFSISCNGLIRLDRIKNGMVNAVLKDWSSSGQVAPGASLVTRLGVWVVGGEMRFFINGYYQFTVRGLSARGGQLGIFARSGGDTALTVNFSDLVIRSVDNSPSTPTQSSTLRNSSTPVSTLTPINSFTPGTLPAPKSGST
jgi:hypothetical protein